jgi:hypothetical protein
MVQRAVVKDTFLRVEMALILVPPHLIAKECGRDFAFFDREITYQRGVYYETN